MRYVTWSVFSATRSVWTSRSMCVPIRSFSLLTSSRCASVSLVTCGELTLPLPVCTDVARWGKCLFASSASGGGVPSHAAEEDVLGGLIERADTTFAVLKLVDAHLKVMNNTHMLAALSHLFTVAQQHAVDPSLVRDQRFLSLCDRLASRARFYTVGDVVNILKYLNYLGVDTRTKVMTAYLKMLRELVNDLHQKEISYLSFLLKKMAATPVVQALRMALPIVFENKIDTFDEEDPEELVIHLKFAVAGRVSHRTLYVILEKLANERLIQQLSPSSLGSLLMSMADCTRALLDRPEFEQIVTMAVDTMLKKDCSSLRAFIFLKLAAKIARQTEGQLYNPVYNARLVDRICDLAISQKVEPSKLCWLAGSLRQMSHHNVEFADCLASEVSRALTESPKSLSPSDVTEALSYFAEIGYKAHRIDVLASHLVRAALDDADAFRLPPLLHLLANLQILELPCDDLVSHVLGKANLDNVKRTPTLEKRLALLSAVRKLQRVDEDANEDVDQFWRSVEVKCRKEALASLEDFSLAGGLAAAFGGANYVRSCAVSPLGLCGDHVLILRGGRYPAAFKGSGKPSDGPVVLSELEVPADGLRVIVNVFREHDMCRNLDVPKGIAAAKSRLLAKMDDSTVVVNIAKSGFQRLLDREKIPYLVRTVETAVNSRLNADDESLARST